MPKTRAALAIALSLAAAPPALALPMLYEEAAAHQEEGLIVAQPIGGLATFTWKSHGTKAMPT